MPIASLSDYRFYLEADRLALGQARPRPRLLGDEIWRFQRALRAYEHALACRKGPLGAIARRVAQVRWHLWSLVIGVSIPPFVFGPGLSIAHRGAIVVNGGARVGRNCRVHSGVNLGTAAGEEGAAPVLGDDVYLGPGAKLFGAITVADRVAVGANAVVNKSVETPDVTVGGVPARVIAADHGARGLLIRGAELAEGRR